MSTPLTDSINALTAYANEVTGGSDTNLSDAVHTLASGYGGGIKIKTGSFVGSKNKTQAIEIGFEPDIFYCDCGLDPYQSGWEGQRNLTYIKNVAIYQMRHNNTTVSSAQSLCNARFDASHPYGIGTEGYDPYATYDNGIFTVTNMTNNLLTQFINGQTYNWVAIKYT